MEKRNTLKKFLKLRKKEGKMRIKNNINFNRI